MNRFKRLIAYSAMTAALLHAVMFVGAQQTGAPYINQVTGPGTIDRGGASNVDTAGVNNTYSSAITGISPGAGATDIACLTGSATKRIHLSRAVLSGTAVTPVNLIVLLRKLAAVNSGGTNLNGNVNLGTPYAYWSTNAAATASITAYTASPTANDAAPGVLAAQTYGVVSQTNATMASRAVEFLFGNQGGVGQPTLLSAAQQLCVNIGGVTVNTGLLNVTFEWYED